jgi:hypothetical protein
MEAEQHAHYHSYGYNHTPRWVLVHLWHWWKREHKDQVLEWSCEKDASLRAYLFVSEVIR